MGLLDPVYAGVNSVIAGAGSVAGGAVSSGTILLSLCVLLTLCSTHSSSLPSSFFLGLPRSRPLVPLQLTSLPSRHRHFRHGARHRRFCHQRWYLVGRLCERHRELHHGCHKRLRLSRRNAQQPTWPRALAERSGKLRHEQRGYVQATAEK